MNFVKLKSDCTEMYINLSKVESFSFTEKKDGYFEIEIDYSKDSNLFFTYTDWSKFNENKNRLLKAIGGNND